MSAHILAIDADPAAIVQLRPRVLRKDEAAKYIGCSRSKLDMLIAEGTISAKRAGTLLVLVSVASLDAYLDSLPDARETLPGRGA
jgi:excisionase family DNA binding protein